MAFCPHCGAQISEPSNHCPQCGQALHTDPPPQKNPQKRGKYWLIPAGILAVLLIAAGIFAAKHFLTPTGQSYCAYISDQDLTLLNQSQRNGSEITLEEGIGAWTDANFDTDGKYFYFWNHYNYTDDLSTTADLYRVDLSKLRGQSDRAASNIEKIAPKAIIDETETLPDGRIVYSSYDNPTSAISSISLQMYDKGQTIDIAKGVDSLTYRDTTNHYVRCENGLLFCRNGDLYCYDFATQKSEKLASAIYELLYFSQALSDIVLSKLNADGVTYTIHRGNPKDRFQQIITDASTALDVNDSGAIYYTKTESTEKTLYDYVIDENLQSDLNASEPSISDYTTVTSAGEPVIDSAAYEAARIEYEWIGWRNRLRQELQSQVLTPSTTGLYVYTEGETTCICDNVSPHNTQVCPDGLVVYVKEPSVPKAELKLEEIEMASDVSTWLRAYYLNTPTTFQYCFPGTTSRSLDMLEHREELSYVWKNENSIVFRSSNPDTYGDTLIGYTIQDGQLVSPKTIDSNAFPYYYETTLDRLYYFSNYSAELIDPFESADLYCWNGETTTAIVHDISRYQRYEDDMLLYFEDPISEPNASDAFIWKNGEKQQLAEACEQVLRVGDDEWLYIADHTLFYRKGQENRAIAYDVTQVWSSQEMPYTTAQFF